MQFDLEEWQRLAKDDPAEFERKRRSTIEEFIEQAPLEHQKRLRGLQFRIDLERTRAKTPLGAAIRLQTLMWDRFTDLREALLAFSEPDALTQPLPEPSISATIIPFTRPE